MIYLTSDLHFNHVNILKYEPVNRPFETLEEMNETLIANWNAKVSAKDTVYVLGDLAMGTVEASRACIERRPRANAPAAASAPSALCR